MGWPCAGRAAAAKSADAARVGSVAQQICRGAGGGGGPVGRTRGGWRQVSEVVVFSGFFWDAKRVSSKQVPLRCGHQKTTAVISLRPCFILKRRAFARWKIKLIMDGLGRALDEPEYAPI